MKILKILASLIPIFFLIGCANNQIVNSHNYNNKTINEPILSEVATKKNILEEEVPYQIEKIDLLSTLSKKEKEFLEILKTDRYASLCNSKSKYLEIDLLNSKEEISTQLKDIFVEYTNNLNNSCIDQVSFKSTLKKSKYVKNKQYYELYNEKINKTTLLKEYMSENISIKSTLDKYTPKHPDFFRLIKQLDNNKLSKSQNYKLRLNIERLKLLKNYKSDNFIQLNVPSYNFSLYEKDKKVKNFGTVVGSKEDQTPILSSKLSYFIVNPTWNIPDSIAKESIIPKALKDKNYLKKKNIVIRKNYKLSSKKFKFEDINWKKYLKKNVKYIPYKFIQLPSSTNGMGRVKFMFSNDYAVYMHDTMGTWRFKINKEKIRFVSHGCVRLEHPLGLMKHITKKYTPKTYQSVRKIYDNQDTGAISLSKKLPLHITYMTAYIKNGKVGFYKDTYGYDKIQKLNFNPSI